MDRAAAPGREPCSLQPGPFFFSGRPPFLRGTVGLINHSEERVRVRSLVLAGAGLVSYRERDGGAPRAAAAPPLEVRPSRQMRPLEEARVAAYVRIDRFTPPGEYEARLRLGDQEAPAVVFVQESHRVDLVPDRITLSASAGQTVVRRVAVTNEGNVPFSTRRAALAPLEALGALHRSLAVALTEAGHEGHGKFLDRFVRELADHEVAPAKVKLDVSDQEIAPGETKVVEVSIRLPAELRRRRSYTSRIRFAAKSLVVEVNVEGGGDAAHARTRRAAG